MDGQLILDYYFDDIGALEKKYVLDDGTEMSFKEYIEYLLDKYPCRRTKIVGYPKVFDGRENKITVEDIKNLIDLGLLKDDCPFLIEQ